MFPVDIYNAPVLKKIKAFVCGEMSITDFVELYNETDEMANYLDAVIECISARSIPIQRRTVSIKNVNQNQSFEARSYVEMFIKEYVGVFRDLSPQWKENPPKVGVYLKRLSPLTAYGAVTIHSIVADIYYQMDPKFERTEKYEKEYEFSLDVLPNYLAGGILAEDYVSKYILPKYPATMKNGERKRLVKEEIKLAFQRDGKGFPRWIQMPEWPIGSNEKPMVYTGQKEFENYSEYYFRDATTNENHTVTQRW